MPDFSTYHHSAKPKKKIAPTQEEIAMKNKINSMIGKEVTGVTKFNFDKPEQVVQGVLGTSRKQGKVVYVVRIKSEDNSIPDKYKIVREESIRLAR